GLSPTLVIAGEPDAGTAFYKRQMGRLARQCGVDGAVIWAGQLNSRGMSWCFYHCAAFVMTSRAEACPNIVLEAMSHGCINVSTRQAPMPEFFADAAFYYRPWDASDLAQQLGWALTLSTGAKEACRAAARHRAAQFDWRATARATVSHLELA